MNEQPAALARRIERTYPVAPQVIWELWTTPEGIERWWAPDGFETQVELLDLRPLGELVYTMTATGPEQIDFLRSAGMPLSTTARKSFTEVSEPKRLAYLSLIDFVAGHVPYQHLTTVDIEPTEDSGSRVTMTVAPMHNEEWTERLVAGRSNELDNLGRLVAGPA